MYDTIRLKIQFYALYSEAYGNFAPKKLQNGHCVAKPESGAAAGQPDHDAPDSRRCTAALPKRRCTAPPRRCAVASLRRGGCTMASPPRRHTAASPSGRRRCAAALPPMAMHCGMAIYRSIASSAMHCAISEEETICRGITSSAMYCGRRRRTTMRRSSSTLRGRGHRAAPLCRASVAGRAARPRLRSLFAPPGSRRPRRRAPHAQPWAWAAT